MQHYNNVMCVYLDFRVVLASSGEGKNLRAQTRIAKVYACMTLSVVSHDIDPNLENITYILIVIL